MTPEQFWQRVDKNGPNGCWIWTGNKSSLGYGVVWVRGMRRKRGQLNTGAHRYAYEALVGPIPDGLVIDHLCRNPSCVNPAHLEPVTIAENLRRGLPNAATINAAKTHCPRGHEYPEPAVPGRRRYCWECRHPNPRGEPTGHARQRGAGWELRVYVGRHPETGKKVYRTKTVRVATRDEAEAALAEFLATYRES